MDKNGLKKELKEEIDKDIDKVTPSTPRKWIRNIISYGILLWFLDLIVKYYILGCKIDACLKDFYRKDARKSIY